jgi:hypothetical protein
MLEVLKAENRFPYGSYNTQAPPRTLRTLLYQNSSGTVPVQKIRHENNGVLSSVAYKRDQINKIYTDICI